MVDVSIIIVSWNVCDLLRNCLRTIYAQTSVQSDLAIETIVVDSASEDTTLAMLASEFPQVIVQAETENVGFTRGNNIGLAKASGRYLFLLNPDTEIIGDAIRKMTDYLDEHPEAGIIGPHTLNSDGTTQSSRRRFHNHLTAFFESTWLQPLAPARLLNNFYVNGPPDDAILDVDWVQGSALMARRTVYEQIGPLDDGYIMYSEEMDWCKRARLAGWRVVYLGTSQIIHHGGKSTDQAGARKHIHFQESKLRYFRKYHGMVFAQTLRFFLLASYTAQMMIEAGKSALGSKRDMRQERIRTYWQVITSGLRIR